MCVERGHGLSLFSDRKLVCFDSCLREQINLLKLSVCREMLG